MEPRPDCFVSGAFVLMLRITRFVGLAPLRFDKHNTGWQISLSPALRIYGNVVITILVLAGIASIICDIHMNPHTYINWTTRSMVSMTNLVLIMLIACISVYGAWNQMETVISCLEKLQKINLELNRYIPRSLERNNKMLIVFWIITTVVLISLNYVQLSWNLNTEDKLTFSLNLVLYTLINYFNCILYLQELLFVILPRHILNTFKTINDRLRNLLEGLILSESKLPLLVPCSNKLISLSPKRSWNLIAASSTKWIPENITNPAMRHHDTLRGLSRAYTKVCDTVREVDRCYGLILLLTLGSGMIRLIEYTHLILYITYGKSQIPSCYAFINMFGCLYHAVNIIMMIEPCHLTHTEMETTRELVSHLMHRTHSIYEPLAVELELFYRLLVLNQVSYSPLGVITLTRSLVATIFATTITYLFILIAL